MAEDQGTTTAPPGPPASKGPWRRLLTGVLVASILLLILITILAGEVIPPFIVFIVLFVVGWVLLGRGGKAGPIVLIVGLALWLVLNVSSPFILPALFVPLATYDFIIAVMAISLGIVGLIAAIAVLKGRDGVPSGAARKLGTALVAIVVLSVAVAVVARVTYHEPTEQSGDVQLTTVDVEFEPGDIEADGGEISIYVTNEDDVFHTFTIDELDVDEFLPGGVSTRITFDAEPGTYEFYCVPHTPGMEGELTVQ